jgi:ketosteroid isomerase-like protein
MTHLQEFNAFLKQRERASYAFVNGDATPLDVISTHTAPATIFGPVGNTVEGADNVNAANAKGAEMFASGGESHFEIQQSSANDDLAFWAGIQRSTVRMKNADKPVPMDLRVTEMFRREDGAWKLVHRHADPLKASPE